MLTPPKRPGERHQEDDLEMKSKACCETAAAAQDNPAYGTPAGTNVLIYVMHVNALWPWFGIPRWHDQSW